MSVPAEQTLIDEHPEIQETKTTAQKLMAFGGILGALATASCCIVPLVLFTLGVSGAWIGNRAALAPYQPIFLTITFAYLGVGFYKVYRKPKVACAEGSYCAKPVSNTVVKIALWSATILVAAALAFPYVAPWLLGV